MKSTRYKLHTFLTKHTLFYGYRWAAWIVAFSAVTLRHIESATQLWLLVLTLILTFVLTAFYQPYLRIVRRRPLLLLLDIFAGVALIWASGGGVLPFVPYALGSLILPALLFGWRMALAMSFAFLLPDSLTLLAMRSESGQLIEQTLVRTAIPVGFTLFIVVLPRLIQQIMLLPGSAFRQRSTQAVTYPPEERSPETDTFPGFSAVSDRAEGNTQSMIPERTVTAQLTTVRAIPPKSNQEPQRSIYGITANPEVDFHVALNQAVCGFSEHNDIDIHLTQIGPVQYLTPVQYSVLLKLAHEALRNIEQHAQAHTVQLTLHYAPRVITLTLEDDGVGLLDGTSKRPGFHALQAIQYRFAELNGHLDVFEGERGGVVVRGTLPL